MKERKWFYRTIIYLVFALVMFALIVVIVDPYFHFHAPIKGTSYRLYEERYINDGIARHFDYDAIITGTSMTQNFKTSEFDELFGTSSIKLPFSGGGPQEISQSLQRAFDYNNHIEKVLWGLDGVMLIKEYDYKRYEEYPTYLYDDLVLNDVNYVLNKSIFYHGVLNNMLMTLRGDKPTTFDEYSAWERETGYDVVKAGHEHRGVIADDRGLSDEERKLVEDNIRINVCSVIEQNPDTTFYIFFPPYSILFWDYWDISGKVSEQIEAESIATELILQYPNVELFCFNENVDLISNFDNYSDELHYRAEINSLILKWINDGEYRLTLDNYHAHEDKEKEIFLNYVY
ncbi:MAG: hypothetical protein NC313_06980 [Butyrivibrio sp.]|nr:hypothetical protein [Butyrivibrio sp.]